MIQSDIPRSKVERFGKIITLVCMLFDSRLNEASDISVYDIIRISFSLLNNIYIYVLIREINQYLV